MPPEHLFINQVSVTQTRRYKSALLKQATTEIYPEKHLVFVSRLLEIQGYNLDSLRSFLFPQTKSSLR